MTKVRQRQDLLDEDIYIPATNAMGEHWYDQLTEWTEVKRFDDEEGLVWTDKGIFYSIDLDHK